MTSQDVVEGFLNSFRRSIEADPDQRWINSFNTRAMIVSKFFKRPEWVLKLSCESSFMPTTSRGVKPIARPTAPRSNFCKLLL
jgi:hypothetical protein